MSQTKIVYFLLGAVAYFAFLKFRGVVGGMPWSPVPAAAR